MKRVARWFGCIIFKVPWKCMTMLLTRILHKNVSTTGCRNPGLQSLEVLEGKLQG